MNLFARMAPSDGATLMVIQVFIQISLVVLVAAAIDRFLARRHAATRHAVWVCALLTILIGPALVLGFDLSETVWATIRWRIPRESRHDPAQARVGAQRADQSEPAPSREPIGTVRHQPRTRPANPSPAADPPRRLVAADSAIAERIDLGTVSAQPEGDKARQLVPAPAAFVDGPDSPAVATVEAKVHDLRSVAGAATIIWLFGIVVFLARLIRGVAVLAALRRSSRAVEITTTELAEVLERVRAALGVARLPVIASSPRVAGPAAIGVLKPVVILPQGWFETIPAESLRELLIHECAHLVHRDPLIGVVQRIAELVYWPHVLVHWLNHKLSRAREEACDDFVISQADAIGYARTLVALAGRFDADHWHQVAPALMSPRWKLEDRVAGLLDPRRDSARRARAWKLSLGGFALIIASVACAGVRWEEAEARQKHGIPTGQRPQTGAAPIEPRGAPWPIPGIVVDRAGKPVSGAAVRLARGAEAVEAATTGPDGKFVVPAGAPILPKVRLIATRADGLEQGIVWFTESSDSDAPAPPARIVLKPSRSTTVKVTDQSGKPIPDAAVGVIGEGASMATGKTDAAGHAVLRYPDGMSVSWIIALLPGAGLDYYENYRSWPSDGSPTVPGSVALVLNGAKTLRLKVVNPQDRPVSGVVFRLGLIRKHARLSAPWLDEFRPSWSRTDRNGIAQFDWVPSDVEGGVSVGQTRGPYFAPELDRFELVETPAEVTVRVVKKTPLRGKAVKPDGRPAAGILIEASGAPRRSFNEIGQSSGTVRTASDGTYQLMVIPDRSYMVGVFDQNWAAKSQPGLFARENEPCDVPELRLIKGTVIRGRVTIGADRKPLAGQPVLLSESGATVPGADSKSGRASTETLTLSIGRQLDAGSDGRFTFRVGPGAYEFSVFLDMGSDKHDFRHPYRLGLKVGTEEFIDRELHLDERKQSGEARLTGVVRERSGSESKPVADAEVIPLQGFILWSARAVTDAQGRFELGGQIVDVRPKSEGKTPLVLYARNRDGTRAGLAAVKPAEREVSIDLKEAGRVTGQVVDDDGKPLGGREVNLTLNWSVDKYPAGLSLRDEVRTDNHGRYTFTGLVVGESYEVKTFGPANVHQTDSVWERRFEVENAVPISLPSLIVQAGVPGNASPTSPIYPAKLRPDKFKALARPATVPAGPSRAEIEGLIRTIGRDPVSARLVDRVAARFDRRFRTLDLDSIRQLATRPEFTERMDGLARDALGKPLDTIMLLRCAMNYEAGYDDTFVKLMLRSWRDNDWAARTTIRGRVVDVATDRPIRDARVSTDLPTFTDEGFVRTDGQGEFRLSVSPRSRGYVGDMELRNDLSYLPVWVEADGYALALRFAPLQGTARPEDLRISLKPEAPLFGTVVDPAGKPIVGAVVEAFPIWADFMTGGPKPDDFVDVLRGRLAVRTDSQGRFSFTGLPAPAPERSVDLAATHTEFQDSPSFTMQVPTDPQSAPVITLKPGCAVLGVVVNRRGMPVPGASVRVYNPSHGLEEGATLTDREGRFRFRNLKPGRWNILIQAQRLAAAWTEVVASPAGPVQNQFVLEPGDSIGGKVVDKDGKPVVGASVGCVVRGSTGGTFSSELALNTWTLTDDHGSFRLGPLPARDLRLTAWDESRRRTGNAVVSANRADVVIKLAEEAPDP